jgi:cobaltochelatase CobS
MKTGGFMTTPVKKKIGKSRSKSDYQRVFNFAEREKRSFPASETFNISFDHRVDDNGKKLKDGSGNFVRSDKQIQGYDKPTEHTPDIIPDYVFPNEETKAFLLALSGKPKDPTLLLGQTGCGKTSLAEQIAARLNFSVIKISYDAGITRPDIVGEWVVKDSSMEFQYGWIPYAFCLPGTIIILDEWDAQNEETAMVLQRPLQKEDRKIFLLETLELIPMHPENFICGTANTNGQGDDTGLYSQGTRVQNYAQLNRFTMTIKLDYPKYDDEFKILKGRIPELFDPEIDSLVSAVNKVRDGFTNGQLSVPLSTRDLINWGEKYVKYGSASKAATYCFLNRMNTEDAKTCEGLIQRAFERSER